MDTRFSQDHNLNVSDAAWLRDLYLLYRDELYRSFRSRVASDAAAEDVLSETFLRAAKNVADLRQRSCSIRAWLYRVGYNLIIDDRRSAYTRKSVFTGTVPDIAAFDESPDEHVITNWVTSEIRKSVRQLNAAQGRCLQLRFEHGLSVGDTATLMDKSALAVRQLQQRAVRRLRELLAATSEVLG